MIRDLFTARDRIRIDIVGPGYGGLPSPSEFGNQFLTVDFDISAQRIEALEEGCDRIREVARTQLTANLGWKAGASLQEAVQLAITAYGESANCSEKYLLSHPC